MNGSLPRSARSLATQPVQMEMHMQPEPVLRVRSTTPTRRVVSSRPVDQMELKLQLESRVLEMEKRVAQQQATKASLEAQIQHLQRDTQDVRQKLQATIAAHEVKLGFEESLIGFVRHQEEKEREGRRRWPWLYKDMKSKNRTRSSDNIRVPTPRSILSSSTLDGLPRQPIPSRPASER